MVPYHLISMEVKDFLCGLPSLTKNPPIQTLPTPLNPTLPNTHTPPFSIQPHPSKLVSFQTHLPFAPTTPKVGAFWRFKCVNKEGFLREEEVSVRRKRLAVFVSGGGSNFKSIHEACVEGMVRGDVVVLVTNKRECGGAEFARNGGIPVILFPKTKDEPDGLTPDDLVDVLRNFKVDFILLAGYLKLLPAELIRAFPRSIVNIHPSLLPAFGGKGYYGIKVHKAVIASGARYSGPTIHFVDEHYDTGRILAQRVVPVLANDTVEELAVRVLQEEHRLYVDVTMALCDERIIWREDGVPLIRSRESPNEYT